MEKCPSFIHRNAFSVSAVCFPPSVIGANACQARVPWARLRNSLCLSRRRQRSLAWLAHSVISIAAWCYFKRCLLPLLAFQILPPWSSSHPGTLRPGLVLDQMWFRKSQWFSPSMSLKRLCFLLFLVCNYKNKLKTNTKKVCPLHTRLLISFSLCTFLFPFY